MNEPILGRLSSFADAMHAEQAAAFGWTNLDLRFDVDATQRRIHVTGEVLLVRTRERLMARLIETIPSTWRMTNAIRTSSERASWFALRAPVTRLWRECPDFAHNLTLSTELRRDDGPVRRLFSTKRASLVLTRDGTAGWTVDPLGRTGWSRPWISDRKPVRGDRSAFVRSFLGTPYKAGGTTREGIDCSGLTQTVYRDALGSIIPKHCSDQSLYASIDDRLPLVFLNGAATPSHVGILLKRGRFDWSVVHASSTRGMVVEDALEEYLAIRG